MLEINFIICRFQLRSDKQNVMKRKMILPTVRFVVNVTEKTECCYAMDVTMVTIWIV